MREERGGTLPFDADFCVEEVDTVMTGDCGGIGVLLGMVVDLESAVEGSSTWSAKEGLRGKEGGITEGEEVGKLGSCKGSLLIGRKGGACIGRNDGGGIGVGW